MAMENADPPPPYTAGEAQNSSTNEMIQDEEIMNDPRDRMNVSRITGCHIARPERPEYAMAMGQPPNPRWKSVLVHLRDSMQTHRLSPYHLSAGPYQIMNIIAGILYARECSSKSPIRPYIPCSTYTYPATLLDVINRSRQLPAFRDLLRNTFSNMLRYDHGSAETGPMPPMRVYYVVIEFVDAVVELANNFCHHWSEMDIKQRNEFSRVITRTAQSVDLSDFGTLLYSIHIYCDDKKNYTDMIPTLVGEISSRGPEALIRKLSVDYHAMVPTLFSPEPDMEKEFRQNIKTLADRFNISLSVPTANLVISADKAPKKEEIPSRPSPFFTRVVDRLRGHGPYTE
ncbi:hypothetical protein PG994_002695 [Apiospora phragmitis]|uniref:Uncharacterized protein n=1 Tax=Apiospora phragmitis TaxID=2905665 RepID=A0ABR1W9P5_9PEZI